METQVKTPRQIFNLPQYLDVPLFQRPYVWDEEAQWAPLWADVRRTAELRMGPSPEATHFLGAVVMQELPGNGMGDAETYSLIDGQQRLTTLQLFMDAASAELSVVGQYRLARQLTSLTHNSEDFGFSGRDRLKVRHGNRDGLAFADVMMAEPPVDYSNLGESKITRGHEFFAKQVREWLQVDGDELDVRAEALSKALMQGLQLVVITLTPQENSQEIFETLNARGTPLTAADLIKNLVFQRLAAEGVDTERAYREQWRLFENPFWEKEVNLGRYSVERVSLFLNHWLVAQLGEEVSTKTTYTRFKHWAEHEAARPMSEVLIELHQSATTYQGWVEGSRRQSGELSPEEMFVYRTEAADSEAVKPILIRVSDPRSSFDVEDARSILGIVESWVMRRALVNGSTKDVSRSVAAIIAEMNQGEASGSVGRVQRFLADQVRPGTYWPGDDEVRRHLATADIYRYMRRGKLRMFLETVEDSLRGYGRGGMAWSGSRVERDKMHIEHLLPQRWQSTWPVSDLAAEIERQGHVHRLGNLTLLTRRLNSTISNGAWPTKREALTQHDVLLLTRRVREETEWDEAGIEARTAKMAEILLTTWPVPAGHNPEVSKKGEMATPWVEVRDLVAAGYLAPGAQLRGREGTIVEAVALVTADGNLQAGDKIFGSPSGAGRHFLGRSCNGWQFWRTADGQKLADIKNRYLRDRAGATPSMTSTEAAYESLWRMVLDVVHEEHPTWTRSQASSKYSWITLPFGSSTIWYSFVCSGKSPRVELYFGGPVAEENDREYRRFEGQRERLQELFGAELEFSPLPEKKACRILVRSADELDPLDPEQHEAITRWFVDTMIRFRAATQTVKQEIENATFPAAQPATAI